VQNTEQIQRYTRHNLAKLDKTGLSKEEVKQLMEERRMQKELNALPQQELGTVDADKYYILCLKHGQKYSAEYVNRLYSMVKRNCTLPFTFACLTEDPAGIHEDIEIIPLPSFLSGWWCKPYMFSKDLPIKGTILYMDLDVVIAGNIDKLLTYQSMHWCTIRDFTRAMRANWPKYNSSIVRFQTGQLDFVWEKFKKEHKLIVRKYYGDQDYLYEATRLRQAMLYPDSWIQSWKWEVRNSREFEPGGRRGSRRFKFEEHDAKPRIECCVCVFHGDPNPEHCTDKWVVDNWK